MTPGCKHPKLVSSQPLCCIHLEPTCLGLPEGFGSLSSRIGLFEGQASSGLRPKERGGGGGSSWTSTPEGALAPEQLQDPSHYRVSARGLPETLPFWFFV